MAQARSTILTKHGLFAVISLYLSEPGGMVASFDMRSAEPVYREEHPDIAEAVVAYSKAIIVSKERGWTVVYTGEPNFR